MASNFHNTNFKFFHFSHIGLIKFPFNNTSSIFLTRIFYFSILPKTDVESVIEAPIICKYCDRSFKDVYPPLKFKVSMKDVFGKTAIVAESSKKPISGKNLPPDYWDFVPSACVIDCIQKNDQFSWQANELSACVIDCIKLSKIRAEKPTIRMNTNETDDNPSKMHGLKYMKEVSLGKRTPIKLK
ncbi:hypothetical protein LXL04_003134 [Taraxacum kok-saghyz]